MTSGPHDLGDGPDRSARQAKIDAAGPRQSKAKPALVAAVVLITVLALGIAVWLGNRSGDEAPTASATGNATGTPGEYPAGATGPTGGIVIQAAGATNDTPTLDIYEDFQCPGCQDVERALGQTIKKMATDGEIRAVYHIKTFLDQNLRNDASMRAGNGAACAADAGAFQAYHDQVYAHPPASEGEGWSNDQLKQFASAAGITGERLTTWEQCFTGGTYNKYLQGVEEASAQDGVTGTPTFRVNGQEFDLGQQKITSAEDFRTKVLAAAK